jgi:hypothetical protein
MTTTLTDEIQMNPSLDGVSNNRQETHKPPNSENNTINSGSGSTKETKLIPGSNVKPSTSTRAQPDMAGGHKSFRRMLRGPPENNKTAQYAILKWNDQSSHSGRNFCLQNISIQSPLIKKALAKVFEGYEGVTESLQRLAFFPPFEPFVHRWDIFEQTRYAEEHPENRVRMNLLWKILHEELKLVLETQENLLSQGVMTFEQLVKSPFLPVFLSLVKFWQSLTSSI